MHVKSKILVIDSSESTRIFTRFTLNNDGHRTAITSTGARALDIIKDEMFDIFVIDNMLSDMSGLDLAREIRTFKAFKNTPILLLDQLYSTIDKEEGQQAGVTHWLSKPISPHKLVDMVRDISHSIQGHHYYGDDEYDYEDEDGDDNDKDNE